MNWVLRAVAAAMTLAIGQAVAQRTAVFLEQLTRATGGR